MNELHRLYFNVWHFLFQQIQWGNWFGNVVAGVVVFVVVDVCWQLFAKKWVKEAIAKIHAEELARHHREVVQPALDAHLTAVKQHVTKRTGKAKS
jgi:hypothetical protein